MVHLKVDHLLNLIEKRQVACEKLELALARKAAKKETLMRERGSHSSPTTTHNPSNDHQPGTSSSGTSAVWIGEQESQQVSITLRSSPEVEEIVEDKQVENPTEWLWECCGGEGVHGGQSQCCGLARDVDSIHYHAIKLDALNELVKIEQGM